MLRVDPASQVNMILPVKRDNFPEIRGYQPKPSRITEIPKEDGSSRPLVISCFKDKVVQLAISTILSAIFEPLFFDDSFGFRPDKNMLRSEEGATEATR